MNELSECMVCDHGKDIYMCRDTKDMIFEAIINLVVEKKTTQPTTKENSTQKTHQRETKERRGKQEKINKEDLLASNL